MKNKENLIKLLDKLAIIEDEINSKITVEDWKRLFKILTGGVVLTMGVTFAKAKYDFEIKDYKLVKVPTGNYLYSKEIGELKIENQDIPCKIHVVDTKKIYSTYKIDKDAVLPYEAEEITYTDKDNYSKYLYENLKLQLSKIKTPYVNEEIINDEIKKTNKEYENIIKYRDEEINEYSNNEDFKFTINVKKALVQVGWKEEKTSESLKITPIYEIRTIISEENDDSLNKNDEEVKTKTLK